MKGLITLLILPLILLLTACGSSATPVPTARPTTAARPVSSPTVASAATPTVSGSPTAAGGSTPTPRTLTSTSGRAYKQYAQPPLMTIDAATAYTATIETSKGNITVELLPSEAPKTVNNFVFLTKEGFYDGIIFHRVVKGFMIQGGDPIGNGTGGPGYRFQDEPVKLKYTRGIMAMANSGPNTNGSQFFIMHADSGLPPNYTIFGKVTAGLGTLDELANTPVKASQPGAEVSTPTETLLIKSIKIQGK